MNEQELNKKLAEWAGITQEQIMDWVTGATGEGVSIEGMPKEIYPNFIQSLDACFKWLVPKLNEMGWGINLMQAMNNSYWKCVLWEWGNPFTTPLDHKREDADEPALALCKAVEKLIDELP